MDETSAIKHTSAPDTVPQSDKPTLKGAESRLLNRELSWLAFNARVLEEAENEAHPLLERLRFLSISAANLDEFFMVRVAGIKGQIRAGVTQPSDDGLTPTQQIEAIQIEAHALMREQHKIWDKLRSALREEDIFILSRDEVEDEDLP